MYLSDAIGLIKRNPKIGKATQILILAHTVSKEKFFSLDFLCENMIAGYNPDLHKKERGSIVSIINILEGKKLLANEAPPFEPAERLKFAQDKVEGDVINDSARKTKFVFKITQLGLAEVEKILSSLKLKTIAKFILENNLFRKNKRRAFFLLLSLAPHGKYVSRLFIQDKIEEAILSDFFPKDIYVLLGDKFLENIRTDFYQLAGDGFVERIDVSQRSLDSFKRFCKADVAGSYIIFPRIRRTQIFHRVSCKGKKRVKDILSGKV